MRRAVLAFACVLVALVTAAPALAAPVTNGQLAAVADGRLVALNRDGTGLRTVWTPTGEITGLAWSPDGNKLAFSYADKITVFDVVARTVTSLTVPRTGERDVNPAWSPNGLRIAFRRIGGSFQQRITIALDGTVVSGPLAPLDPLTSSLAFGPLLDKTAWTIGSELFWTGLGAFPLVSTADGTPSWSPDGTEIAYVDPGSFAYEPGLRVVHHSGAGNRRIAPLPARDPRWAPDGSAVAYTSAGTLRVVDRGGENPAATLPGLANVTAVDWQPCVAATVTCNSILPPTCSTTTAQVTTPADQPVALPPTPCSDPASLPLSFVLVKGPDSGTLNGTVYTPNAGFTGQDALSYKVSNGTSESEVIRVTIFVVPRAGASGVPPVVSPGPSAVVAPFLTMRTRPRLDRKRTTIARLECDQQCAFTVRLEGTLRVKKKKTFKGAPLTRTLTPGRVLALKLKLPAKPAGKLKTAWITGTVRGAGGVSRTVKLPVGVR
jgi:hypothetical protein